MVTHITNTDGTVQLLGNSFTNLEMYTYVHPRDLYPLIMPQIGRIYGHSTGRIQKPVPSFGIACPPSRRVIHDLEGLMTVHGTVVMRRPTTLTKFITTLPSCYITENKPVHHLG